MNSDSEPTVVIVPGLRDHVADHLNPAAGYDPWPRAGELLDELFERTGEFTR